MVKNTENKELQTPEIGGVSMAATDVYIEGGWNNSSNFFVTAATEELELDSSMSNIDLDEIVFSTLEWSVDQLKKFTCLL